MNLLMGIEREVKSLGFDFDYSGENAVIIKGIPEGLKPKDEKELFEGLLEQYKQNQKDLSLVKEENLLRALAKRSSIKHGEELTGGEMGSLIDQLFACKNPQYTPYGKPVFLKMDYQEIFSKFDT